MKINFTKFICVSDDFLQTDLFLKHLGVKGGWQFLSRKLQTIKQMK